MDRLVWTLWTLEVGALALALAAMPLAYRRAGRGWWAAHSALVLGVAASVAAALQVVVYADLSPWWQTGIGCLASLGLPPIVAGWAGRSADRRWPREDRWRVGAAVLGTLVVGGYLGWRVAVALLPEVINAVQ